MEGLYDNDVNFVESILRMAQCFFAVISFVTMVSARGFSDFAPCCFLAGSTGLLVIWSFGLFWLGYYVKRERRNPVIVILVLVGDWVMSTLSLAAASSSVGIAILHSDLMLCEGPSQLPWESFGLSALMAFLAWLPLAITAHSFFLRLAVGFHM